MPAVHTHYLVAGKTYTLLPQRLKEKIRPYLVPYFFGAQGADFCFFYKPLNTRLQNFGSYLHRKGGYAAFRVMKVFSANDDLLSAYALGYVTHYAADTTFHPYVYFTGGKSPLRHTKIENAIDVYLRERHSALEERFSSYYKTPTKTAQNELYLLFAAIASGTPFAPLSKPAFLNAISAFGGYPNLSSALFTTKNERMISTAVNAQRRVWYYPEAPHIQSDENADGLFDKSVALSLSLIREFLYAAQTRKPLLYSKFGKNYLSGI